jgi:hypothetical protein
MEKAVGRGEKRKKVYGGTEKGEIAHHIGDRTTVWHIEFSGSDVDAYGSTPHR